MKKYHYMLMAVLQVIVVKGQGTVNLSVTNVQVGSTASFVCSLPGLSTSASMDIYKDDMLIYSCTNIVFPCIKLSSDPDYSKVDFTDLGQPLAKGTLTIANVTKTRDEGEWKCSYDGDDSNIVNFGICNAPDVTDNCMVTSNSTTATYTPKGDFQIKGDVSRTCHSDGTWNGSTPTCEVPETNDEHVYLLFLLVLIPCVGLVVVIIIVSGYKTLVISTLYVKVYKNTVQLSWKPFGFEPVPDTLYAKCAQNGLTENAECRDGLFVVVFRDLVPGQQHDVTVYCQNAADMKLYKSETCVVFTLKDSSNTNPKESKAVLALHSLDLTVYQTRVELSWTSPLAFDSTKVEYWVGSDKHITMSADTTSLATSNAEMTRLLPDSVITFTITGEKNGTQYRSGVLHQKTLKGLTRCCP